MDDAFYSKENLDRLRHSVAQLDAGAAHAHDLIGGRPGPFGHDAYRFERSKVTGNLILPQEWDDPEDDIYGSD